MESYDEFTSLLDPTKKKSDNIIIKTSKFNFFKTLTPFMFLQASVGICASLQVKLKYVYHLPQRNSINTYDLGHVLPF